MVVNVRMAAVKEPALVGNCREVIVGDGFVQNSGEDQVSTIIKSSYFNVYRSLEASMNGKRTLFESRQIPSFRALS